MERLQIAGEGIRGPESRDRLTRGLTRNVVVLGAVSLCTDISSEMLVPVRFLFLVYTLGTPLVLAGLIEGLAESLSSVLRIWAGKRADRAPRRKPLILGGYVLSNGAKPLLAFVLSWQPALGLIIADRLGKSLRASPRDALLADSAPEAHRGKAFGFHRGMDTLGAAIGPLLTVLILRSSGVDLRPVFAWTVIPGTVAVLILVVFLRETRAELRCAEHTSAEEHPSKLGWPFWIFTAIAGVFAIGNFSDAFIFLRTQGLEQSLEAVPLAYFGYNVVYAVLSTPLGHLSDRFGRAPVITGGFAAFSLVYVGWALASTSWSAWVLFLVYGVYAAAIEGAGKAFVTDLVVRPRHGTALGWYNGVIGFAALPANIIAAWLWTDYGPSVPFVFGSVVGLVSALAMAIWLRRVPRIGRSAVAENGRGT